MPKIVVFSTLATDVNYTNYASGGADFPVAESSIVIKGGSGVANDRLITAMGMATTLADEVGFSADEKLAALKKNPVFQMHEKNGFIIVSSESDPEKVAADMNLEDRSRPLSESDMTKADPEMTAVTNRKK